MISNYMFLQSLHPFPILTALSCFVEDVFVRRHLCSSVFADLKNLKHLSYIQNLDDEDDDDTCATGVSPLFVVLLSV